MACEKKEKRHYQKPTHTRHRRRLGVVHDPRAHSTEIASYHLTRKR